MPLDPLALALFVATYALVALGRLPGLKLDRTGFALLGAFAFLATGRISLEEAKASIDAPTLALLFGMMLLSAQYQISGLYGSIVRRLAHVEAPKRLLAGTLVVSALLAAVLTNDVVCFALTPLVGAALLAARRDPLPFFLAIACGTNIGGALTPNQKRHWDSFASTHAVSECGDCHALHLVCPDQPKLRVHPRTYR